MKITGFIMAVISLFLVISCTTHSQPVPETPDLIFWIVGGVEDREARFGENFASIYAELSQDKKARDTFLYALAENPLSKKDIIQKTGLSESKVETLISQCRAIKWINIKQDKWSAALPVITDSQMIHIKESLKPLALRLAENIETKQANLKDLYEKENAPHDPPWEEISHLVIDKLLIDGTFHRAVEDLEEKRTGKKYYTPDQKILPTFILEAGKHAAHFGCNWYRFEHKNESREVYFLHGTFIDRYRVPLNPYRRDPDFAALLSKISPAGDYSKLTQKETDILKDLGWIENESFLIPIIQADSLKPLIPTLRQAGQEMAGSVFSNFTVFIDSFNDSPYSQFLEGAGDYIQACYHTLFALIIDILIEKQILSLPPQPVPDSFAVYITLGSVWN